MSDGGTQADEATVSESYAVLSVTVTWFIITGILIIFIPHSIKLFQDLYTVSRKSVSHRRTKPTINGSYKFIAWMTWCSVFFGLCSQFGNAALYFLITDYHCDVIWTFLLNSQQLSKVCMYWVFIWRLYTIYKRSAYHYSRKCTLCFGVVFIGYAIFIIIIIGVIVTAEVFTYGGSNYPNWCAPGEDVFVVAGGAILLQDFIVAIGFLWAFLRPLKKTIKAVHDNSDDRSNEKITRKIIYAGTKTTIITSFGTFSTIIVTLLAIITGIGIFGALDPLFNSYTVILMTAYYPDKYYYNKLCCLCKKCCEKTDNEEDLVVADNDNDKQRTNNIKFEPSVTNKSKRESIATTTVDTMSALRVAGPDTVQYKDDYANIKDDTNNVNNNKEEVP